MSRRQRQQRGDRDDSGGRAMSTAGKVALGVAAAAAGAAIGYLGSRFVASWLTEEEPDKEEKMKKCDDSKSDDDKCGESKEPSKRDSEAVNKGDVQASAAASQSHASSTSMHRTPAAVHQPSLHEQLLRYYHEYVDIPRDQLQAVQTVVDQLTLAVRSQLHQSNSVRGLGLKIGDLVTFGSATEGHQVIRPNCVDIMIPIMFGSQCRACEVNGSSVIIIADDGSCRDELCDEEHRLVTRKLLDVLQVSVERTAEDVTGNEYQCAVEQPQSSDNATAISLLVYIADLDQVTVNFVPFVITDGHLFLPVYLTEQPDIDGRLWKESFVRQEKWSIDRFDSSICGHVIVLKILKAIRLNHREQFGGVSSYHLKMMLFHVLEDLPDSSDWQLNAVGERLIDLLTRLTEVLSEHELSHYFEQNVNLLQHVPTQTCNNLARFIEKKLAYNDIASLLKRDY